MVLRWRNTVENEYFHFFSLSYHYQNIKESLIRIGLHNSLRRTCKLNLHVSARVQSLL